MQTKLYMGKGPWDRTWAEQGNQTASWCFIMF